MKLDITQCRSAKNATAPRGLRRSARVSSISYSSSRSSWSEQQSSSASCAGEYVPKISSFFTISSPQGIFHVAETSKKTEVSSQGRSITDVEVTSERLRTENFVKEKRVSLTSQRSFNGIERNIIQKRSISAELSRKAELDSGPSWKIEALIEPRVLNRTSSCTTIGRKRVVGVDDLLSQEFELPLCGSPSTPKCSSPSTPSNKFDPDYSPRKRFAPPRTPSTCLDRSPSALVKVSDLGKLRAPGSNIQSHCSQNLCLKFGLDSFYEGCSSDSPLEEIPFDLLLQIVCHLDHDDLRPVSLVCKRLLKAVLIAQECHFCFMTPRMKKKGKRMQMFPSSEERISHKNAVQTFLCPPTPNAPKHSARPAELRYCKKSPFEPCLTESQLSPMGICDFKTFGLGTMPHRVLFDEDELCEAIAQNSL
ncbi:hypothetical protein KP509_05G056900 [Ceratopteris richardii]|uniref:F-box domain-containing protein n=1 Tax=Ceratopteris richardii TaxID=49495 RepID=A0A8T2UTL2_CERRI|nr:hypothetical protein KP509_05G056900 [Ceratopteris richardii]